MNIIFLTLLDFKSYNEHNIYCDLLREFIKNGHQVYCISPIEKRMGVETHFEDGERLLKLKIGNTQKTNIIEKGISTIMVESQFVAAIKKNFANIKFDLVLYSTPPITLAKAVNYIKKRDGAKSYLMLKDIFPQNAVDLGMMTSTGIKGLIYKYFRNKEKKLYAISDYIGCMSKENVNYVLTHNSEVTADKVQICPNSIDIQNMTLSKQERSIMRSKYGIPQEKTIFVYGGNLGKPQSIPFVIDCLKSQHDNDEVYFLIVGDGTEYKKLEEYINIFKPKNVKIMKRLPRDDYDRMLAACDVGMIFLDYRFTIPNFPSRLLTYMQARLPVLACTDCNTDVGKVIVEGQFGWWCESRETSEFTSIIEEIKNEDLKSKGLMGYQYLKKNYSTENAYNIILKHTED